MSRLDLQPCADPTTRWNLRESKVAPDFREDREFRGRQKQRQWAAIVGLFVPKSRCHQTEYLRFSALRFHMRVLRHRPSGFSYRKSIVRLHGLLAASSAPVWRRPRKWVRIAFRPAEPNHVDYGGYWVIQYERHPTRSSKCRRPVPGRCREIHKLPAWDHQPSDFEERTGATAGRSQVAADSCLGIRQQGPGRNLPPGERQELHPAEAATRGFRDP